MLLESGKNHFVRDLMATVLEEDYDTRDVSENELTVWDSLKTHLRKYSQQEERLDAISEDENPIPQKYDPEAEPMVQARQILDNYEEEVEKERENRVDLSDGSIGIANDPDHAKDHDDAYNVFEHEDGSYTAQVHIADVTHFIDQGSPIDKALMDRNVTFYLGDNTRHMTPEALAQDVFSLAPGQDRLALTIEMDFDRNGNRKDTEIYESIVNTEHLTYTHVDSILDAGDELEDFYKQEILENEQAKEFKDMSRTISDAENLADKLRRNRWDESLILNDRDSKSSKIVEELMIEANSAAGDYIRENRDAGLFRVEPEPEQDFGENAAEVLQDYGYNLDDLDGDIHRDTARTLNNFFQKTKDSEPGVDTIKNDEDHIKEVRTEIVKNLERAEFKASLSGESMPDKKEIHDGLEILDYAQTTSPIRRLPDLWNHRILKEDDWTWSTLLEVAENTTQQQMIADEASRVWYDAST